jgi:hypothetical protein
LLAGRKSELAGWVVKPPDPTRPLPSDPVAPAAAGDDPTAAADPVPDADPVPVAEPVSAAGER